MLEAVYVPMVEGEVRTLKHQELRFTFVAKLSVKSFVKAALRTYRVFIKYCVFSKDFRIFRTLVFLCFPLVSVCVHTPGR